jgi:hypothetical protein
VDSSGNAYVAGYTSSVDFPVTLGAFQTSYGGGNFDVFVTELTPPGSALVYSTYLGGSNGDIGSGVAVDSSGNLYLTGWTYSTDFPTTAGALQTTCGGGNGNCQYGDAFVAKIALPNQSTTTTVSSSENPSKYGKTVTFTATVMGQHGGVPTGKATFYDGTGALGTQQLSNGTAQYSTSILAVGSNSITAVYSGDSNFQGSTSSPLNQTVNQGSTTVSVGSSVNPSTYDQAVTFTAMITPQYGGGATGTVSFYDGTTQIGSGQVANDIATLAINSLSIGNHSITASYGGDTNFTGSTSTPLAQVLNKATTTTSLVSSINPAKVDQIVTFTATVAGQYGGTPTGNVEFMKGNTDLGTAPLINGQATLNKAFSGPGTKSITAVYAGDANFSLSTSPILYEGVGGDPSTTTLGSSVNPCVVGQQVTFTATVSSDYGSPTGTVTFMQNGANDLGTAPIINGQAALNKTYGSAGSRSIAAIYSGDSNFDGSTSSPLLQVVNQASTTTTLGSSLNPSIVGQQVTFTATVSSDFGSPTGTVTFYKGEKALGTATLNSNGVGQLTTSTLPVGTHPMSAVYSGDTNFEGSTSPPLDQTINQASTTTTLTSSPNPSAVDQQVTFTAIVTPLYGGTPTGTVTFTQNGDNIGTAPVINGQAIFSKSFGSEGMKSMGANYSGDTNFTGSSGGMTQTVN